MTVTLRDYQERAIESCIPLLSGGVVCAMATGGGKTVTAVRLALRASKRALWLAHRRELLFQARDAIEEAGGDVGLILAGEPARRDAPIQVASVQTLARRELPDADLLVVDECHHVTTTGLYAEAMRKYARRLGLTATPQRLDGRGLRAAGFSSLVVAATPADLCDSGVLHAPTVYGAPPPDMSRAKVRMGEYRAEDLQEASRSAALTGKVVETWLKRADGRRTVVFAVDIAHAEDLASRFRAAGVEAEVVTGETPKPARSGMLARLSRGITRVVVNVGVLTEGWDLPALEVACIARPTASLTLHLQCLGRIMRAAPGKDGCLALDHAGNHQRHGFVTDARKWSLDDKPKGNGGEAPAKRCEECEAIVPAGCRACPHCGAAFPVPDRTTESAHELEILAPGHADTFQERAARWRDMVVRALRIARAKTGNGFLGWDADNTGKAHAIASSMFKARYGVFPLSVQGRLIDPTAATPGEWEQLRAGWRKIGDAKGWPPIKTAWFIRRCEADARGVDAKNVSGVRATDDFCSIHMDDGTTCSRKTNGSQFCGVHMQRKRLGGEMGAPINHYNRVTA